MRLLPLILLLLLTSLWETELNDILKSHDNCHQREPTTCWVLPENNDSISSIKTLNQFHYADISCLHKRK